jgi:glutamate N-acetyltransferase/amino-acid N-acetyltransferase
MDDKKDPTSPKPGPSSSSSQTDVPPLMAEISLLEEEEPVFEEPQRPFILPKGFKAAAVASGARYKNRLDLSLLVADPLFGGAATFTRNLAKAAPVLWSMDKRDRGRAVLVNAGQANAQTGTQGYSDCETMAGELARCLPGGPGPGEILLASTGVIGQKLNMEAILSAIPALPGKLAEDGFEDFASAILTTDTREKMVRVKATPRGSHTFEILGCVKGSGMIAPNMATMLGFLVTDLAISSKVLDSFLKNAVELSFNRLSIDGDTSTNDSVFILSSGTNPAEPVTSITSRLGALFERALNLALNKLSGFMAEDAEGGTKVVRIRVKDAPSREAAHRIARVIAESPLVKTAFYGCDPNWGRVIAAIGRSGIAIDPYRVSLFLDEVLWVEKGMDAGNESKAKAIMEKKSYTLTATLGMGEFEDAVTTSDLSPEYVLINGSYRS